MTTIDKAFGSDAPGTITSALTPPTLADRLATLARAVGSPAAPTEDPDPVVRALVAAHHKLEAIARALEEREQALAVREARVLAGERAIAACEALKPILAPSTTAPAKRWFS